MIRLLWIAYEDRGHRSVTSLAIPIMILKLGLHAYVVPDFGLAGLMTVLGRTPVWTMIGLLAGLPGDQLGWALQWTWNVVGLMIAVLVTGLSLPVPASEWTVGKFCLK